MNGAERIVIRYDATGTVALIREAPVDVVPLFLKAAPGQVPALARSLFAICGEAHSLAATLAIEAAQGHEAPDAVRDIALWTEIAREHGLRIALDWPRATSTPPDHATARRFLAYTKSTSRHPREGAQALSLKPLHPRGGGVGVGGIPADAGKDSPFGPSGPGTPSPNLSPMKGERLSRLAPMHEGGNDEITNEESALGTLIAETITGHPPALWLAMDTTEALQFWAKTTNTAAARFISSLFDDPVDLPPLPEDDGSVVARNADHPLLARALPKGSLLARHIARLIDLCRAPARIAALASGASAAVRGIALAPSVGLASVPCSRGTLTHEVTLSSGRIASYRVDPPTWRLFAPGGAAETGLSALRPGPQRRRLAEALILALDPCVETVIEGA